jgi:hypothetical protein
VKIIQAFVALLIPLLPAIGAAQGSISLAGKWVVDQQRMQRIDPAWDGTLTRDMWIATFRLSDGRFRVARGVDADEGRGIRNEDTYDPSGKPTTIYVGDAEASSTATWEGERLVAKIRVLESNLSFTRVFYREGPWLVVEEHGRSDARWSRTYFIKT